MAEILLPGAEGRDRPARGAGRPAGVSRVGSIHSVTSNQQLSSVAVWLAGSCYNWLAPTPGCPACWASSAWPAWPWPAPPSAWPGIPHSVYLLWSSQASTLSRQLLHAALHYSHVWVVGGWCEVTGGRRGWAVWPGWPPSWWPPCTPPWTRPASPPGPPWPLLQHMRSCRLFTKSYEILRVQFV